jgi:hypothetical protein
MSTGGSTESNVRSLEAFLTIYLSIIINYTKKPLIVVYLTSLCVNWHAWPRVPKKAQFTQERVEYHIFLFDEPLKGSKLLKTFKISLRFRFDKL